MTREEAKKDLRSYRKQLAIMANRAWRVKELEEENGAMQDKQVRYIRGDRQPVLLRGADRMLRSQHTEAIALAETAVAGIMSKLEQLPILRGAL